MYMIQEIHIYAHCKLLRRKPQPRTLPAFSVVSELESGAACQKPSAPSAFSAGPTTP